MSPAAAAGRPQTLLPEPDRLWIAYAPRRWPAAPPAQVRWLDLAGGRLGRPGDGGTVELHLDLPGGPFDDVLYLPPVAAGLRAERDRAAAEVAAQGTPVLVQLLPGEPAPAAEGVVVYDLLEPLLAGDLDALAALPPGSAALWPLVAGLTDSEELCDEGVRRLAEAGAAVLHAVSPDLPPEDRRRLFEGRAEGGHEGQGPEDGEDDEEEIFTGLFHGDLPDPRPLARTAHAAGMAPFHPRPLPRPPLQGAAEREAAGLLALAGELHLRLGRLAPSQALFRAARFLDRTHYDLRALAREGNLPVLHWLDDDARQIVQEWAATGRSVIVDGLVREYLLEG